MNHIKLADGSELEPLSILGKKMNIQGQTRDVLQFVFSGDTDMSFLDETFSDANCAEITILDDENIVQGVFKQYGIRDELKKENVVVQEETPETAAVYEERIFISMAQKTYTEITLSNLVETVDLLVLDSLM